MKFYAFHSPDPEDNKAFPGRWARVTPVDTPVDVPVQNGHAQMLGEILLWKDFHPYQLGKTYIADVGTRLRVIYDKDGKGATLQTFFYREDVLQVAAKSLGMGRTWSTATWELLRPSPNHPKPVLKLTHPKTGAFVVVMNVLPPCAYYPEGQVFLYKEIAKRGLLPRLTFSSYEEKEQAYTRLLKGGVLTLRAGDDFVVAICHGVNGLCCGEREALHKHLKGNLVWECPSTGVPIPCRKGKKITVYRLTTEQVTGSFMCCEVDR